MTTHRARPATAALLAAGLALTMAACAPGGGGGATEEETGDVSTDVAAAGDVTLRLTDFWGSAEGEWIDGLVAEFEKTYPNVTIERTQEDWGQLNSTLNLQLQDADGPDIASANNGWQSLGTLGKGGLVLNLDPYAEAYGWDDLVPTTIKRQNTFTTDFATMGEGSWFGTPVARTSLIGLYYNVEKLDALGIDPPTDLDSLESAAAAAKAAGEIPFQYGSMDGSTSALLGVQALLADRDQLNDYIYDSPDVTAEDVKMTEAVETVARWAADGWFPDSFEGIDYQTAVANYLDGQGVFRWEYTGSLGLDAEQQTQFGYLQLPQADGSTVGVGAAPGAMVVSAKSAHPDVAAAFLDFLMSPTAAQQAADLGLVPALDPDVQVPAESLSLTGESAGAAALDADDGYVPYFDWSSPSMLDTISQNIQLVYAGRMTAAEFTAAVDADRDAFLADQG